MHRVVVIISLPFVVPAYAKSSVVRNVGDAQDAMDNLVEKLVDNLTDKLLGGSHTVKPIDRVDLDHTVLAKPGHPASPTSSLPTRSAFSSPASLTSRVSSPSPVRPSFRSATNVIKPRLSEWKRGQQLAQAIPLSATAVQLASDVAGMGAGVVAGEAALVALRALGIDTARDLSKTPLGKVGSEVGRLWLGQSQIPVAAYRPSDIGELFGGALFLVLQRFKNEYGSQYLLPTGLSSSFLVLSDPASAKHVLDSYSTYEKGLVREISQFLFGDGFAVADGKPWKVRRRAISPSFHKKYLDTMVQKIFANCSLRTAEVLASQQPGHVVNMEKVFSELTLDIIGKAVFNYDFKSIYEKGDNPVIEAVYTALKEVETRSLDFAPVWKLPGDLPTKISPRQKSAADAVAVIRKTTEDLVENCRLQLEAEERTGTAAHFNKEDYISEADPSILRFLIASKEEVKSNQLRDDLLSMLVAGHETTASVLTWTLYLLTKHPEMMAKVQEEIDDKLGAKINSGDLTLNDLLETNYLRWCIYESMRLYPHPPVLIRRALEDDVLPNGMQVPKGQDVMVSVYNIHHSESVWKDPEEFLPERWSEYNRPKDCPNERNTNYNYIPFSGGARRCIGDQFALLESFTAMATLLHKFDFKLVEGQDIRMTTGATIHTTNGMMMTYTPRNKASPSRQVKPLQKNPDSHHDADVLRQQSSGCPFSQLLSPTSR